jgi:plastocyanin
MRRPYFVVLAAALMLIGCGPTPAKPTDPEAITMDDNRFQPDAKTIDRGATLTFANTAPRALHILVVGTDARERSEDGAPSFGGSSGIRTEVGDQWTSDPWATTGTFHVTCTLHPSMNLTLKVT